MLTLTVCALVLTMAAPAFAQSGADGLGAPAPRGHVVTPPAPAAPAANSEEEPPVATPAPQTQTPPPAPPPVAGQPTPEVSVEALPSTVPPPPTGAPAQPYGAPRYVQPQAYAPPIGFQLPSRLATRMRIISSDLQTLGARSGNGLVDGILSFVSGGLSIGLGVWARRSSSDRSLSSYLFLYGAANLARGVVDVALSPRPTNRAIRFTHMPMTNLEEAEARLRFGEDSLEFLARRARLSRILQASINIAAGLAVIPIYLGPNDYMITGPVDVIVMIGSGISVVTGIIGLLNRTTFERRWSAYRDMRSRLSEEPRVHLNLPSIAPVQGGALLTSGGTF